MVGDGDECNDIRRRLQDYGLDGSYLILSNRQDVPEIMRAMDVFIFPSLAEGLGIVLVEAQLSKLKCVVSERIPKDAFLTDLVIEKNLDEPISAWVNAIVDNSIKGIYSGNLDNYNMRKEIRRLEEKYLEKNMQ